MYAHRNFHQNALSVPWLTIKTSLSSFASVKMMLMALFSLYTSWCWKKLRLILSFIMTITMCWKEEKVRSKLVGAKYPFPFHRFPVVWERCHINQSLDSFHLRDQQSLSPMWSRIRWQFVKKVRTAHCRGLCNFDNSYDFSSIWPACNLCAIIAIFPRKLSSWFLIFSINICNELFNIFLSKALLLSNIYKCYSSLIWPGHPRIQHSIVFVLLAPKWGRTWYEGGGRGHWVHYTEGAGRGVPAFATCGS